MVNDNDSFITIFAIIKQQKYCVIILMKRTTSKMISPLSKAQLQLQFEQLPFNFSKIVNSNSNQNIHLISLSR